MHIFSWNITNLNAPRKRRTLRTRHGFTLIEMAVVLIIIGLVIGGVIAGQHLQRVSQLQSIPSDTAMLIDALNQFQAKYGSLPGDMPNATNYWGAANADATICQTTVGAGKSTCNGNGDGRIRGVGSQEYEVFRALQQLSNAGMLRGTYTGVTSWPQVPGTNILDSKIDNAGFIAHSVTSGAPMSGNASYYDGDYGLAIAFGKATSTTDFIPRVGVITAVEASDIDTKMDDGAPTTGKVRSYKKTFYDTLYGQAPAASFCTSGDTATATYQVNMDVPECSLLFITGIN